MFDRFDESAQKPMVLAREEARRLGHQFIDTEHILLALLKLGKAVEDILWLHNVDPAEMRRKIEEIHPPSDGPKPDLGQVPFSPWVAAALMTAAKEAQQLVTGIIGRAYQAELDAVIDPTMGRAT